MKYILDASVITLPSAFDGAYNTIGWDDLSKPYKWK